MSTDIHENTEQFNARMSNEEFILVENKHTYDNTLIFIHVVYEKSDVSIAFAVHVAEDNVTYEREFDSVEAAIAAFREQLKADCCE